MKHANMQSGKRKIKSNRVLFISKIPLEARNILPENRKTKLIMKQCAGIKVLKYFVNQ